MDYKDVLSGQVKDNFWSMGKRDLIAIILAQHVKPSKSGVQPKILNIGAGVGDDLKVINTHGEVYLVDIDGRVLELIPEGQYHEKRVANIQNLPYNAGTFDIVACFDVFEHVEDDLKAFAEVHRVLKKGGLLLFTVPAFQYLYSAHDRVLKHARRYDYRELQQKLSKFSITFISYWNCILSIPVAIRRLVRKKAVPREDVVAFSRYENFVLFHILHLENLLLKHRIKLPFGLSICGICKKYLV